MTYNLHAVNVLNVLEFGDGDIVNTNDNVYIFFT